MIFGSQFSIRTIVEQDLDDLVSLLGDTTKQGDFLPVALASQSQFRRQFEEHGFWSNDFKRLVIVAGDGHLIGTIWIFRSVPYFDALELGYKLFDRDYWGKGLMSEAMALIVDYLFSSTHINRLEIRCDVENIASAKVATKIGFLREGTARQATFARGKHHDMHLFAMLRSEWEAKSTITNPPRP